MKMSNEQVIDTARALLPLVTELYEAGVTSINGTLLQRSVHVTPELFHDVFCTWYVEERGDKYIEHHHKLDGVDVFCLLSPEEARRWSVKNDVAL